MGISSYKIATTTIPLPPTTKVVRGKTVQVENSFTLRGLGLEDFGVIITNNLVAITNAAEAYAAQKKDMLTSASLQGFVLVLVKDFPGLMMEVISIASDEPEAKNVRLPASLQIAALTEIAKLTLTDAGGLGNLLAILGVALRGVGGDSLPGSLKQLLSNASIGDSGKKSTSSKRKDT